MVVHLAAASHEKALGNILSSVAAAAGKLQLFKKMNTLALHLSVADKIESGCQTGKTGADDVCGFFIHILRLFGMGKRFISSCGIIHIEASCFLSARIFCCERFFFNHSAHIRTRFWRRKILIYCVKMLVNPTG